jgi:hypothetical protein
MDNMAKMLSAAQVDAAQVSEDAQAIVGRDNHHVTTSGQRRASECRAG